METVKVIVYYMGRRYGHEEVPVDSPKDAILKTICDKKYPRVYMPGMPICKISADKYKEEKKKVQKKFTIHTAYNRINREKAKKERVREYWQIGI